MHSLDIILRNPVGSRLQFLRRCGMVGVGGVVWATTTFFTVNAQAAGLYFQEQGAVGIGRANAGSAAAADDESTIFFNPAGMTNLDGASLALSTTFLMPRADFSNEGSTATTPGNSGAPAPISGGDGGNPFGVTTIPNLYVVSPVAGRDLWLGFSVTAPFGMKLEYDDDWFGRYESTYTDLQVIDFGPSVAYRVSDSLSIGGGLDIQYANATLENRIPDPMNPGGPTAATDGNFRAKGDSFALGFNVGLTFTPVPSTRFGVHYRHGTSHELEGDTTTSGLTGPLAGANGRSDMKADLDLPAVIGVGVAHELTSRLTLLGQFNYFTWSEYEEVRIRYDDGSPDVVREQNYDDSISVAVGAEFDLDQRWTLRGGFQYEETPTTDPSFRSTRVPDGDRYYVTAGASYAFSDNFSVDFAYAHVFVKDGRIDRTDTYFDGTGLDTSVTTSATYEGGFDVVAVKGVWSF
ncbi:outer membrane protein transport protein [Rhodospirillaceae bacterium SYSU D60014]|uniref:OmpP1/FadL family transporter n=1 Tax=Virgifigura deserti TaxID=2268457 RepID=UPI000E66F9B6